MRQIWIRCDRTTILIACFDDGSMDVEVFDRKDRSIDRPPRKFDSRSSQE